MPEFCTLNNMLFNTDPEKPPIFSKPLKNTYDLPESSKPLSRWFTLITELLFLNKGEVALELAKA